MGRAYTVWAASIAIATLVALPLAQGNAYAAGGNSTWYISPTGTDRSGCGIASGVGACASLQYLTQNYLRGQSIASPGDTIIFTAGTYGPQSCAHFNDVQSGMNFVRNLPVQTTIEAQGVVTITRPTDPSVAVQTFPLWFMQQCYDMKYIGFKLVGMVGRPDENHGAAPGIYNRISVIGRGEFYISNTNAQVDGSVVQNVSVTNASGACLKVDGGDTNQYLDNTLRNCGQPGNNYDDGAYLHGSNTMVSGNVVSGSMGACLGVYGQGSADIITNNTVSNCGAGGILSNNTDMSISGNTAFGNGTGIFSSSTGSQVMRNTIYGNTLNYTSACVDASTFAGCGFGAPLQTTGWWGAAGIANVSDRGATEMWQVSGPLNSIRRWRVAGTDARGMTQIGGDIVGNGMSAPVAVAAVNVSGRPEVWVLNGGAGTISRFHTYGAAIGVFGIPHRDPHLNRPTGMVVDGGNVYITDHNPDVVHVYAVSLFGPRWKADLTNSQISAPVGLGVIPVSGGAGNELWVVNGNSTIARMNESTGAVDGSLMSPRTDPGAQAGTCADSGDLRFLGTGAIAWFGNRVWIGSTGGFVTYTNDGTFEKSYLNNTSYCSSQTRVQGMVATGNSPEVVSIATAGVGATPPLGLAIFGSRMWTAQSGGSQINNHYPTGLWTNGEGATVVNNTLYQNGAMELLIGSADRNGPIVENNIVYGGGAQDQPWEVDPSALGGSAAPAVWAYNDFYNTAATGDSQSHAMASDPRFMNPPRADFRLRAGSPAIGAGTPVPGLSLPSPTDLGAVPTVQTVLKYSMRRIALQECGGGGRRSRGGVTRRGCGLYRNVRHCSGIRCLVSDNITGIPRPLAVKQSAWNASR